MRTEIAWNLTVNFYDTKFFCKILRLNYAIKMGQPILFKFKEKTGSKNVKISTNDLVYLFKFEPNELTFPAYCKKPTAWL